MNYDLWSSLFWLVLSISVFIESLRLGIGIPRNPGMGFMAFGASGLLGILSLILFVKALVKEEASVGPLFAGRFWERVVFSAIALILYAKLMPVAGYLISTFLLMTFLFWIAKGQRWWWVLISSFITTIGSYYFFSKWLNCQFPAGLFGL